MPPKHKHKADEHASRINFLFQAAQQVAEVAPMLSQHYGQIISVISEKTAAKRYCFCKCNQKWMKNGDNVNRDYTMKRSMCKKCNAILVPGVNMTYRLRKRKHKKSNPTMLITCKTCQEVKSLPTKPGKLLKAELVTLN